VGLLFGGRILLPILFGQAARTKNPEVFLAVCLLTSDPILQEIRLLRAQCP